VAKKKTSSQAEKIVTDTKRKAPAGKTSKKKPPKKAANRKTPPKVQTEYENPVSTGIVAGLGSFGLCVLLGLVCFKPEGALLLAVQKAVLGLVGKAGLYFLIPALLYTGTINLFGKKQSVPMRSFCSISFALLCGVVYHLAIAGSMDFEVKALFDGGVAGTAGGVICGGVGYLLRWGCGITLALLICVLAMILTLLGAVRITVPSLIRAIANRPRDDWDDGDDEDIEPAALVVNKIANKQIEQKRQRREKAKLQPPPEPPVPIEEEPAPQPRKPARRPEPVQKPAEPVQPVDTVRNAPGRGAAFMSRVDEEISAPLAGTSRYVHEDVPDVFDEPVQERFAEPPKPENPGKMPELVLPKNRPAENPVKSVARENPAPVVREAPASGAREMPKPEKEDTGKVTAKDTAASARQVAAEIADSQSQAKPEYCFPPLDLLKKPARAAADGTEEMRENSRRLNETLASFNIDAHIINVTRGPSVTRYEVELDRGVRLNKLTGCADDIALSLGASGVRIAAVPGKISVVGIEVPNRTVTTVSLREVIDSNEFSNAKSKTSVALGKSIDGNCVVGNIAKMPHLLIAGTTGSGKSVCMNSIIISLLYKAGPEDIKLIMVDPKINGR